MNESGTKQEIPMSFNLDDFYTTQEQRDDEKKEKIEEINIELIDNFKNHPFKVLDNEELKDSYGKVFKLYDTQIPRAVKAAESSRMGESILTYDKDSNVARSYIELAKEVLDDERIRNKTRNSNELQSR